MVSRLSRTAAPALLLAIGACATPPPETGTEPPVQPTAAAASTGAQTYQLVEINGQPLPVFVGAYESCREYAVGGTLALLPDGRYRATPRMREVCADRTETETEGEGEVGTYTVQGSTVAFREEAIERERLNRWEDGGAEPAEIPIEDLGGTGTLQNDVLQVRLADDRSTATFRAAS